MAEFRIELDRPRIEEDRFIVLLECGHWVHTRNPDAGEWYCPVVEPLDRNDGMQQAAVTTDGVPAVIESFDLRHDNRGEAAGDAQTD